MQIEGRVRIYNYKGRKQGKVYEWKQAKIIVKGKYLDILKQFDKQTITLYIGDKKDIQDIQDKQDIEKAIRILLEKFLSLDPECQKRIPLNDEEFSILQGVMKKLGLL